jgi:hypothetical protein
MMLSQLRYSPYVFRMRPGAGFLACTFATAVTTAEQMPTRDAALRFWLAEQERRPSARPPKFE